MKRRAFIRSSLAAVCTASAVSAAVPDRPTRPVYELRAYHVNPGKQPLLDAYLSKALLPTLKRFGFGPVGVFVEKSEQDVVFHVLVAYPAPEQVFGLSTRLAGDEEYLKAAADYLAAAPTEPVYSRIDSSLLTPFDGLPQLDKPDASKPRLFNLRTYESHNERAAKKKIEMFNKGEIAIFKRCGLTPVFFGETVVGAALPNLTYLLVFPDDAGREAAWKRFRDDSEWIKLKGTPGYADKEIVSKITNKLLTPTAYSEI